MQLFSLLFPFFVGTFLWKLPHSEEIPLQAWQLLSIFVATIIAVITKPLPMGAVSLTALAAILLTGTLSFEQAFSGFSNDVVWLIVFAFFVARGFIKTGLGSRIAYCFMRVLGQKTLGLAYGIAATDLSLAPAIPSVTARCGAVIFPIVTSISQAFDSHPNAPSSKKMGAFLTVVSLQASCVASAMFLTSMAANPLIAELAKGSGVEITWGSWALASVVPGLTSLALIPYLIYKIFPPEIKETPHAAAFAQEQLEKMGPVQKKEWLMATVFTLLIFLWIFGSSFVMNASVTALLGLVLLLFTKVLSWKDIQKEEGAWDTLVWFSVLLMMASQLNKLGVTEFFSQWIVSSVQGTSWPAAFALLSVLYFYSHYFFASNLAHVGAMYSSFLVVAIALGTPPGLAALVFAFFSSLFGGITHYACGPAAILFGAGFVKISDWWRIGGIVSIANVVIWLLLGSLWWKIIGIW